MSKVITTDTLKQAIKTLLDMIKTKLGVNEKAEVSSIQINDIEGSVTNGGVHIEYDSDNNNVIFNEADETDGGSVILPIPEASVSYTLATLENEEQNMQVNSISSNYADMKLLSTEDDDGIKSIFSLPGTDTATYQHTSRPIMGGNSAKPGGTLLTTRYRSIEHQYYDIPIMPGEEDLGISSAVYNEINFVETDNMPESFRYRITLLGPDDQRPCEHWIEINLPELDDTTVKPVLVCIAPTGDAIDVKWDGGLPDWNTLKGCTVQVHVLHGIALWGVIGKTSTVSDGVEKTVFNGFSDALQVLNVGDFMFDSTNKVFKHCALVEKVGGSMSSMQRVITEIQPNQYHLYYNKSNRKFYIWNGTDLVEQGIAGGSGGGTSVVINGDLSGGVAGSGDYQSAVAYAGSNNVLFAWLLESSTTGARKVIWHVGDGEFIDAFGGIVTE